MWISPIFNRTLEDIKNKTNKAYCNYADLNRLETNCRHLADIFNVTIQTKTNWTMSDFPSEANVNRIQSNIATLRAMYYTYHTTPPNPLPPLNEFNKWNSAEKILSDIYTLYQDNFNAKPYTGEIYTGQGIGVI